MPVRAFIAVEVDASPELRTFCQKLKDTSAPLRMVNLDELHSTLKFLGDTEEDLIPQVAEVMQEAAATTPPLDLAVKGTGAFPNLNYMQVVWVGLEPAAPLTAVASHLNKELASLGFRPEGREFTPHATVARVKGSRNKEQVRRLIEDHRETDFGASAVSTLKLKKSVLTADGPVYSDLESVPLRG